MSLTLASVTSSATPLPPQRILIYGAQGLGKTTFGTTFPAPVLLRTEDGAAALDVPTFPLLTSYQEALEALAALHGPHPYQTLVLDSLDWLEPLVHAHTCARLRVDCIERPGFGRGYIEADTCWRTLLNGLDSLRRRRGMTIVLLAHAEVRAFTPPDAEPYDRYQLHLHKRACNLFQEWSDMVLFCDCKPASPRGVAPAGRPDAGLGARVIHTEARPGWLAKNRWGLPADIEIGADRGWNAFHQALAEVAARHAGTLRAA